MLPFGSRSRALAAAAALLSFTLPVGCASPCARVAQTHRELTQPQHPVAAGDHMRMSIPFELIDHLVHAEIERVPKETLKLPSVAGVSLGTVTVGIDRVIAMPAPASELGFRVDVSLRSGRRVVLPIRLAVRVKPRLDTKNATVVVALDRASLVSMDATLGPGGTSALTDALWSKLPSAARMLTSKAQVRKLTDSVAQQLLGQASTLVRQEMLDDLGRVARIEIDLPPIPVDGLTIRSTDDDLIVGLHTPLPSRGAVPASLGRLVPKNQIQLSIHASAAVELANLSMGKGEIPGRFGLDGAPDDDGPLEAHLGWKSGGTRGSRPLEVHAFLLDPEAAGRPKRDCAHITLGATPKIRIEGGHLVLATDDAKVQDVQGSVAVRTGLLFSGVSRRSFSHVEQLAAETQFTLGRRLMAAKLQSASLRGDHLVVGLSLAPRRSGR